MYDVSAQGVDEPMINVLLLCALRSASNDLFVDFFFFFFFFFWITFSISMYIMCVCLFSALSRRVGALQMSIIIILLLDASKVHNYNYVHVIINYVEKV